MQKNVLTIHLPGDEVRHYPLAEAVEFTIEHVADPFRIEICLPESIDFEPWCCATIKNFQDGEVTGIAPKGSRVRATSSNADARRQWSYAWWKDGTIDPENAAAEYARYNAAIGQPCDFEGLRKLFTLPNDAEALRNVELARAIELADSIRRSHNGVFGVDLYLGHDGHNACELRDYDEVLAKGQSGRNLLEAVKNAAGSLFSGRYLNRPIAEIISDALVVARELKPVIRPDIFYTEHVIEAARRECGYAPSEEAVVSLLEGYPRVVRLSDGYAWMVLPDNESRFIS